MIYIFLLIISIILWILGIYENIEIATTIGIVGSITLSVSIIVMILDGIYKYAQLVGQRIEVISLKQEIRSIKEAYYKEAISTNNLVNLDNIKQSTNLSRYIANYATKKSIFNRTLKEKQTWKQMLLAFWFGDAIFIPKKILDIKSIK